VVAARHRHDSTPARLLATSAFWVIDTINQQPRAAHNASPEHVLIRLLVWVLANADDNFCVRTGVLILAKAATFKVVAEFQKEFAICSGARPSGNFISILRCHSARPWAATLWIA